ncbi:halo transducer protein [Halobellus salinisoli]|uniref:halo transducer protein n=1 Tax=Halobellus salinisoli TaxID=3108500 RepID=UPI003008B466
MVPDRTDDANGVIGLSTETAVERILAADATRDCDEVRSVLAHVTTDDRVTREEIDATVSDVSKRIATAETRAELARSAFESARSASAAVGDLDVVADRFDRYETTLDDIETRVPELGAELQHVSNPDDDPDTVYEAVSTLRQIASCADDVQRTADELQFDLEDFEAWLGSHERRRRAFEEDVDVVADALDSARAATEDLDEETWVAASLRIELVPVFVSDFRAELDELRVMAARDDVDDGWDAAFEDRLDELESRAVTVRSTLEKAGDTGWRETHRERIAAFERAVDGIEPPIEWRTVYAELERARALAEPYP